LRELAGAWDLDVAVGVHNDLRTFGPDVARLAVAHGDVDRARAVASLLEALARSAPLPSMRGAARRAAAIAEQDAAGALAALDDYRASPRRYEHALAAIDAMELCAVAGRVDDARAGFDEAVTILGAIEARADLAWTHARARAAGLHVRAPRASAPAGWDSLLDIERQIVELAMAGSTNRTIGEALFLSHRTVENRLTRIFAKLGVRSRVELAGLAPPRPGRPGPAG
jgi:DNA-binding CsgD family transcriptional regulator